MLRYAVEDHPLGTAGAIRFAAQGLDERLVVCNGDVLTTLDLGALVAFHDERGAEATICLTKVDDPSAFGVVPTRADGEVVAFVEKPPKGEAPTNWINAGTYVLEPSVLQRIPERLTVSIERETFPRMLEEPSRLYAMASDTYWIDIGTPEKYLQAHADVLAGVLGALPRRARARPLRGSGSRATRRSTPTRGWWHPCCSATARASTPGARVAGSAVGAGASVAAGARVLRAVVHERCRPRGRRRGHRLRARSGCHPRDRRDRVRPHHRGFGRGARRRGPRVGSTHPSHRPRRARACVDTGGVTPCASMVTGGAGFIGSTLVDRLLAEGCDVDAIDDLSTGALANLTEARAQRSRRFSFHRLDIRSPQLADLVGHRRPEVIFHLAAQLDVRVSVAKPLFDAEVNVLGSLNVCEAAIAAGTRKVVFAGSGGTLYGIPDALPVRESHPQRPISPYGVSKKAAGDYLHYYREVRGLEYTELALANVYGPRQDPQRRGGGRRDLRGRMLAGRQPTVFGDGAQTRDYVFVDDVVDAFVARHREGWRAADEHRHRGRDQRARALRRDGRSGRLRGAARTGRRRVRESSNARALDPGRAAIHLGWKPWTALDEGLGLTVDWFRDQSG